MTMPPMSNEEYIRLMQEAERRRLEAERQAEAESQTSIETPAPAPTPTPAPTPAPAPEIPRNAKPDQPGGQVITIDGKQYYIPGSTMYEMGFRTPDEYYQAQQKGFAEGPHPGKLISEESAIVKTKVYSQEKGGYSEEYLRAPLSGRIMQDPEYLETLKTWMYSGTEKEWQDKQRDLQAGKITQKEYENWLYGKIEEGTGRGYLIPVGNKLLTRKEARKLSELSGEKKFEYAKELGLYSEDSILAYIGGEPYIVNENEYLAWEKENRKYAKELREFNKWVKENIKSDDYLSGVMREKGIDEAIEAWKKRHADIKGIYESLEKRHEAAKAALAYFGFKEASSQYMPSGKSRTPGEGKEYTTVELALFARTTENGMQILRDYGFKDETLSEVNKFNQALEDAKARVENYLETDKYGGEGLALRNAITKLGLGIEPLNASLGQRGITKREPTEYDIDTDAGQWIDSKTGKPLKEKEIISRKWEALTDEQKLVVAMSWDKNFYKKSYFAEFTKEISDMYSDMGIFGSIVSAPTLPIMMPIAKQLTLEEAKRQLAGEYKAEIQTFGNYIKPDGSFDIKKLDKALAGNPQLAANLGYKNANDLKQNLEYYNNVTRVTPQEWAEAAATAALDFLIIGGAGLLPLAARGATITGLSTSAGIVFTKSTVEHWKEMSPGEKALAVGMDALMFAPVAGMFKRNLVSLKEPSLAIKQRNIMDAVFDQDRAEFRKYVSNNPRYPKNYANEFDIKYTKMVDALKEYGGAQIKLAQAREIVNGIKFAESLQEHKLMRVAKSRIRILENKMRVLEKNATQATRAYTDSVAGVMKIDDAAVLEELKEFPRRYIEDTKGIAEQIVHPRDVETIQSDLNDAIIEAARGAKGGRGELPVKVYLKETEYINQLQRELYFAKLNQLNRLYTQTVKADALAQKVESAGSAKIKAKMQSELNDIKAKNIELKKSFFKGLHKTTEPLVEEIKTKGAPIKMRLEYSGIIEKIDHIKDGVLNKLPEGAVKERVNKAITEVKKTTIETERAIQNIEIMSGEKLPGAMKKALPKEEPLRKLTPDEIKKLNELEQGKPRTIKESDWSEFTLDVYKTTEVKTKGEPIRESLESRIETQLIQDRLNKLIEKIPSYLRNRIFRDIDVPRRWETTVKDMWDYLETVYGKDNLEHYLKTGEWVKGKPTPITPAEEAQLKDTETVKRMSEARTELANALDEVEKILKDADKAEIKKFLEDLDEYYRERNEPLSRPGEGGGKRIAVKEKTETKPKTEPKTKEKTAEELEKELYKERQPATKPLSREALRKLEQAREKMAGKPKPEPRPFALPGKKVSAQPGVQVETLARVQSMPITEVRTGTKPKQIPAPAPAPAPKPSPKPSPQAKPAPAPAPAPTPMLKTGPAPKPTSKPAPAPAPAPAPTPASTTKSSEESIPIKSGGGTHEDDWTKEEIKSAVAWRDGFVVHAIKSPYRRGIDEKTYNIKNIPNELKVMEKYKGRGSQQSSIKAMGKFPDKLTVDVGNQDIVLTRKEGNKLKIQHSRDRTGTISNMTIKRNRHGFIPISKVEGVISRQKRNRNRKRYLRLIQ